MNNSSFHLWDWFFIIKHCPFYEIDNRTSNEHNFLLDQDGERFNDIWEYFCFEQSKISRNSIFWILEYYKMNHVASEVKKRTILNKILLWFWNINFGEIITKEKPWNNIFPICLINAFHKILVWTISNLFLIAYDHQLWKNKFHLKTEN
jgi:hypothetical protein